MKSILARSLFKSYDGINAVDGIDLDVDEGQIFGFLGPNGAGKSTVIKMLTTLIQPTGGEITVLKINAMKDPLKIRKKNRCGFATTQLRTNTFCGKISR